MSHSIKDINTLICATLCGSDLEGHPRLKVNMTKLKSIHRFLSMNNNIIPVCLANTVSKISALCHLMVLLIP